MKKLNTFSKVFLLFISISCWQIYAVKPRSYDIKISSKIFGSTGYEINPYRSPDTLYDYVNRQAYSKMDLRKPDMYVEYGYDVNLKKRITKSFYLEFNSVFENKKYFQESILNTDKFNAEIIPSYKINSWLTIGAGYQFEKRAVIDADILGEQTRYVMSYIGNTGQLFVRTTPFHNNTTSLYYTFDHKKYNSGYSSYTPLISIPDTLIMDNNQHTLEIQLTQNLSKRTRFGARFSFYDRQYITLPSFDSLLVVNTSHLRHYTDYYASVSLTSKLNNYLEVMPYLKTERRVDMFNDYFSYSRFDGGLQSKLSVYKFILNLDLSYKIYKYDRFEAPTIIKPYPALQYQYYNASAVLTYKIINGIDINLSSFYVNRISNADRPTWKYRRGYDNFYAQLGFAISPEKLFQKSK